MSPLASLALYSLFIVLGAVVGAAIPLRPTTHVRRILFLSFAAGVMLGAAFFHMMPEAYHSGGYATFAIVPLGFGFMLVLERYVLAHTCEEPPDCQEHHGPGHALGLTAFLGMSAHTVFDGIALGSAVSEGVGLMAFIAIAAHKVPSSFSLATILKSEDRSHAQILGAGLAFGLMVPVGAALYHGLEQLHLLEQFASKALAFSAGTFLYIAVSDLLPHVNRHGKDNRGKNLLGLAVGLLVMFALSRITNHVH